MLENEEQKALFRWVNEYRACVPELKWLHHIPNGGDRNKAVAAQLKLAGVMAGVADLFLPIPRRRPLDDYPGPDRSGYYHGLYIELKRIGGEKPSGKQADFLRDMQAAGYKVVVAFGYVQAWHALEEYLGLDMPFAQFPEPRPRDHAACP